MAEGKARTIYGITLAAAGLGIFGAAVGLAVAANEEPGKAPEERLVIPKGRRHKKRARRPAARRLSSSKKSDVQRRPTKAPLPRKRGVGLGSTTETAAIRPTIPINKAPPLSRPTVGMPGKRADTIRKIGPALTGYPTVTPGLHSLSPEERAKRRLERKKRQLDTLNKRIQSLEQRIDRAKDGGRSPKAIERMEQSLERMKQRRGKLEQALEDDR